MSLTDREKEQLKAMIDAGEAIPARYRAELFAEPSEAKPARPGETAEAADVLRVSERRLQLIVEAAPNAVVMIDRSGEIVMVNAQAERVFGYSRAELVGQPVEMLVPERFRGHHPELRAAFFVDPRPRPMGAGRDLYGLKKDGSEFPIEIGLNPIETDDGTMVLSAIVDITERKAAEAALRESEQRFRLVVEAAPNAMVMSDQAGQILMVNTEAERLFGYSRAELVGQPVEMLVPERFRGHHPGLRAAFFVDPRPRPMGAGRDLYGLKKDGSEFPVEIGLNPIETDNGTMVLSAIVDITERKAADQALRESEQRYSVLVDGVTDYAIFMLDPKGIITNWNSGAERIKGYRADEIVGQHFSRFYTEEDRAANKPQLALEIAVRDGSHEAESLRVRKDGSRFWANVVVDAIKGGDGQLIGFVKITRDITERIQSERAREEARIAQAQSQQMEAIRLVIDTIPALVWSALPDGSVDFVSHRWLEYTGLSLEEALGSGYAAAFHRQDLERWLAQWPARASAGRAFEDEIRMRRADGEYRHFLTRYRPLHDASDNIVKWYGAATDIEDRKRAEALQSELARVVRLTTMGEVTASIAHEIIQPLSAVVTNGNTCLYWLEDQTMDRAKARSAAARAVRDAERATDIIRHIRALMTKSETQRAEIDMNGLVTEVLALTHNELLKGEVSAHTVLAPTLLPIFGDRVQLQQLILNLIMNGIEAMASVADRPKELTIETRAEGTDHVLVLVRDSGVGLNPKDADQLFDAFFTTKPEGTGMGLAICRSIVEAHDGRIWASAGSPYGAVFQFTLPTDNVS